MYKRTASICVEPTTLPGTVSSFSVHNSTAAQSLMTVLSEWIEYCGTGASTSHETARSLLSRPHGHSRSAYIAIRDAPNYVYDIKNGAHLLPSIPFSIETLLGY